MPLRPTSHALFSPALLPSLAPSAGSRLRIIAQYLCPFSLFGTLLMTPRPCLVCRQMFLPPKRDGRPRLLCAACTVAVVVDVLHAYALEPTSLTRSTCLVCRALMSRRRGALTCSHRCRHLLSRAHRYVGASSPSTPRPCALVAQTASAQPVGYGNFLDKSITYDAHEQFQTHALLACPIRHVHPDLALPANPPSRCSHPALPCPHLMARSGLPLCNVTVSAPPARRRSPHVLHFRARVLGFVLRSHRACW